MLFNKKTQFNFPDGFSLIEVVVASAVFAVLALGIFQAFGGVSDLANNAKAKVAAVNLANEQIEIARNLPYSEVGIVGGWPPGKLPRERWATSTGFAFKIMTTVRNIDDPFDGTIGGDPNDLSPADYKLVEVEVSCESQFCHRLAPVILTTTVSPKNLETSSGNGALFIRVFDASGQPIPNVDIKVTNLKSTTTIIIEDKTNNDGMLQLVDIPPGEFTYRVEVSKAGYSSARTYTKGELGLLNPINPDVTVLPGQLTQLSLMIDLLSKLTLQTVNHYCQPVGPFNLKLEGTRLLGTDPDILRYSEDKTIPANGVLVLGDLVWDTYKFEGQDSSSVIVGSFPLQSVLVPPGTDNIVKLVLGPKSGRGLLVAVKDGSSGLPLSDVSVNLSGNGENRTIVTNRGYFIDSDWSEGVFETDGNLETRSPIGDLKLLKVFDNYRSNGYLVSDVFDSGATSTVFYDLNWLPTDQASSTGETSVRFQIATGNDSATTTWQWLGPDGTAETHYSISGSTINPASSPARYLRYRVLLSTEDSSVTPNISDIAITYGSACLPFGQAYFNNLATGAYEININKTGYQPLMIPVVINQDWQILEASLNLQ